MTKPGPLIADLAGIELDEVDRDVLRHPRLGGLILFSRNYESKQQLRDLVRCIREVREDLLVCVDHEGGRVQRFREGFTHLPPMHCLAERFIANQEQALLEAKALGHVMAAELCDVGLDFSFAPVLDLADLQSQVIGDRAFSGDAEHVTALAKKFIEGMHSAGMKATAKHFPGHGGVIEDSHLELPIDKRSFELIEQTDLQPFKQLSRHYDAVMTAHIQFPELDEEPVSYSRFWIQKVLREQLGFDGLVFSDDLSMKGAEGHASDQSDTYDVRVSKAINAGCDVVLICNQRQGAEQALEYMEACDIGDLGLLDKMRKSPTQLPGASVLKADELDLVEHLISKL
ncbi:beta-N-acetylhexosaminidase [Agaribacterium sp. ZY112]|uniref:beta-N-acetylhexosaminidase n=1 Tax=Agaribacterium sp. ZY112 TaxID=3233574 RepID=UPI003523C7FB